MASTNTGGNTSISPGSDLGTSPYQDDIGSSSFGYIGKIPIEYLEFLIGTEIFTLFGDSMINEAFEHAFKEITDAFSPDVIINNLGSSGRFTLQDATLYNVQNWTYTKRILRVLRQNTTNEDSDGSDQYYWTSRKIGIGTDNAQNPHSVYFENDPFSPVWYVNDIGGLNILPKDGGSEPTGKVYYMSYPKFGVGVEIDAHQTHNLGNVSGNQNLSLISSADEEEIFHGAPVNSRVAIYLSTALNLCSGYISNHVQDDEDGELVQLLNAQIEWIGAKKAEEVKMLAQQYGAKNE